MSDSGKIIALARAAVGDLKNEINGKQDAPESGAAAGKVLGLDSNLDPVWMDVSIDPEDIATAVDDWLDEHPEATTTVEDGSITRAKLNSGLANELDILDDNALIKIETDKSTVHNGISNNKSITFYGNQYAFRTAKYANTTNIAPESTKANDSFYGTSYAVHGRFLTISGTSDTGTSVRQTFDIFDETLETGKYIPAGNYKFYFHIDVGSSVFGSNGCRMQLRVTYEGGSSLVTIFEPWYSASGDFEQAFTFTSPVKRIRLVWGVGNGNVYNGFTAWYGIYTADTVFVDTNETVESEETYTLSDASIYNLQCIDTMQHESIVDYIVNSKEYVDNHIPSIDFDEEVYGRLTYVSPEMFGAKGDGSTEDATALGDCFTYAATYSKAVRGYGSYKTSSPINITGRGMDVYLKTINYTGNQYAVAIKNREISFEFDVLTSSGKGVCFVKENNTNGSYCRIKGTKISSSGDCISAGGQTLYNNCEIRALNSSNGNCITFDLETGTSFYGGEYVFRDCSCDCPNGWVLYNPHDAKCYNFTVEGNCKNGIYHPCGVCCYGWRHTEFILRYAKRVSGDNPEYQNGALIKFSGGQSDSTNFNTILYDSENIVYPFSIDTDDIPSTPQFQGEGYWWQYANNQSVIRCCVAIQYDVWGTVNFIAKEMRIIGTSKVMIPLYPAKQEVSDSTYDLRYFDTCDITTIHDAAKVVPATEFDVKADTTIYLSGSYCAVGINEIVIDTNSHDVIVYDNRSNKIFDSTGYSGTSYRLRCIANGSDKGLSPLPNDPRHWTYDGTNHVWEIEVIT